MAFTSETKKELENYISGHLPNKEWYESHFYPFIENKSLRDRLIVEFINARKIYKFFEGLQAFISSDKDTGNNVCVYSRGGC